MMKRICNCILCAFVCFGAVAGAQEPPEEDRIALQPPAATASVLTEQTDRSAASPLNSTWDYGLVPPQGSYAFEQFTYGGGPQAVTWELEQAVQGVSLNAATGRLAFSSQTPACTLEVLAKAGENVLAKKAYPIKKLGYFGETIMDSNITGAEIAWEADAAYLKRIGEDASIGYTLPEGLSGRVVVEGSIRAGSENIKIGIAGASQTQWVIDCQTGSGQDWIPFQIILDTAMGTQTALIDGSLYGGLAECPLRLTENYGQEMKLNKILCGGDVRSLTIYYPDGEAPPSAFDVTMEDVAGGESLAADYQFFSPQGLPEACNTVLWLTSDAANGDYVTVGTGTLIPQEKIAGKWVKCRVLPACDTLVGKPVESAPVLRSDVHIVETLLNGTEMGFVVGDNRAFAEVLVQNRSQSQSMRVAVVIAYYENGMLRAAEIKHETVEAAAKESIQAELLFTVPVQALQTASVKVMVWEMGQLKPLMMSTEIQ